jgi:2-keto-3-deoxy-L-rhamnonate aldolase RhmA
MHIIRPNDENVRRALDQGSTMLALGLDNVFMEQSARASLKAAGR